MTLTHIPTVQFYYEKYFSSTCERDSEKDFFFIKFCTSINFHKCVGTASVVSFNRARLSLQGDFIFLPLRRCGTKTNYFHCTNRRKKKLLRFNRLKEKEIENSAEKYLSLEQSKLNETAVGSLCVGIKTIVRRLDGIKQREILWQRFDDWLAKPHLLASWILLLLGYSRNMMMKEILWKDYLRESRTMMRTLNWIISLRKIRIKRH